MHKEKPRKNYYISVAGLPGSGKTTAAKALSKELGFRLFEENVGKNNFLPFFYSNPKRWAFYSQMFYVLEKVSQLSEIESVLRLTGVVQDSLADQDRFTYAKAQYVLGNMTVDEYGIYERLFKALLGNFLKPDVIVQLDVSIPIIESRINKRGRSFEKKIDTTYLRTLSGLQGDWLSAHHSRILRVDADNLDISSDEVHRKKFVELVKAELGIS